MSASETDGVCGAAGQLKCNHEVRYTKRVLHEFFFHAAVQVIFNILVANTDAHAKNYSMLLSGGLTMAPLYDVSTVLHWDHVNQYHAQKLEGRKPADMVRLH